MLIELFFKTCVVVNDDFDMDWLDALQPAPAANDRQRSRSADATSNDLDSESVLDDLIKELKLGDSSGKASSTGGGGGGGGGGWEPRNNNRKAWDSNNKSGGATRNTRGSFSSPAPKEDQFDSFEAYLDALVFEKKGTPAASAAAAVPSAAADKKWGKPDKDSIYSSARLDFEADDSLDSFFLEERDETDSSSNKQSNDYSNNNTGESSPVATMTENKEVPSIVDDSMTAVGTANGDLNALSVKELKERLKEKGMKVSGTKAELIGRLLQ